MQGRGIKAICIQRQTDCMLRFAVKTERINMERDWTTEKLKWYHILENKHIKVDDTTLNQVKTSKFYRNTVDGRCLENSKHNIK